MPNEKTADIKSPVETGPASKALRTPEVLQKLPHVGDRPLVRGLEHRGLKQVIQEVVASAKSKNEEPERKGPAADEKVVDSSVLPPEYPEVGNREFTPEEVLQTIAAAHAHGGISVRIPDEMVEQADKDKGLFRREDHKVVSHIGGAGGFFGSVNGAVIDADAEHAGRGLPRSETVEWGNTPERLPSIEDIEKMERLEEVVDVLWGWHGMADREPSLMWRDGNEEKMDAAFAKFSEMADDSRYDMTGGKLVGIARTLRKLQERLAPAHAENPNDPNLQLTDEYEGRKARVEELERLIKLRMSVEANQGILPEREQLLREQRTAYDRSQETSLSLEDREAARIEHINKGHAIEINRRREQRDPLNIERRQLAGEVREANEAIRDVEAKIAVLNGRTDLTEADKDDIRRLLERNIEKNRGVISERSSRLVAINGVMVLPEGETLDDLVAEKAALGREIEVDPRFGVHREYDKKLEEYGDILSDATESFMGEYGVKATSEVAKPAQERGENFAEMPNFGVVLQERSFAQMLQGGVSEENIRDNIDDLAIEELMVNSRVAQRLARGETLATILAEPRYVSQVNNRKAELQGILVEVQTVGVDAVLERSRERISAFIGEAKRIGLINADLKKFDQDYLRLQSELTPRSAGYMSAEVVEPDFLGLVERYDQESRRYTDQGYNTDLQDKRWREWKGRSSAFTNESRKRFDGLIPYIYERFNMQAADVAAAVSEQVALGGTAGGKFPERLQVRDLVEGEWDIREAEERMRAERGSKLYKDSGSGYYYVFARTKEELELAAEHFAREKIKSGAVKREPNAIFQEREKFVLAMASAAAEANMDQSVVRNVMASFEMEIFAYAAEVSNRNNKPELVAQILQVAGEYEDGMARYLAMTQLLGGDHAAAMFMLDRQGGAEILFRPWGSKNHFGNETHKYLMLHGVSRNLMAEKLVGLDLATESKDEDLTGKGIIYPQGYDAERLRNLLPTLESKNSQDLTAKERIELRMARTQWRIDHSALTPDLIRERALLTGEIVLEGDAARRRNLEKVARFQSKEDFQGLYEWGAHRKRYAQLEAMFIQGEPMSIKEVELLKLGRIQKKIDEGQKLTGSEKSYWAARVSDKRNAVNLAIQFYSMTQQIAVRGDPSFVCGNGRGNPEDIVEVKRDGRVILKERKEAHFVPKHKSKKFIQFADNWAKIEWGGKLRINTLPATEDSEEIKGWMSMNKDEREAMLDDVRHFYDPFYDRETGQSIDIHAGTPAEQKKARRKVRENWHQLTIEEKLKSYVEAKGDRGLQEGGVATGGLINGVSMMFPTEHQHDPGPAFAGGQEHIPHTLWDDFDQEKREIEAAEVWRIGQIKVKAWDNLMKVGRVDLPERDRPKLTEGEMEDMLQEVRFRKRKVIRARAIDELDANGFRATLKDDEGNEIRWKIAVKKADGTIEAEEKKIDVMTATVHPLGQFLGIGYIAQQNEIRNQILSREITDQARAILAGRLRYEDADPLAMLRIEVDPTLTRMRPLNGAPGEAKNLEGRERTMVFAQVHESFYGTKRIEEELRERFHDPDNVDQRISWHWTNEHIGSKRVVNLAEYISSYQNSLSRRMRTNIPYILQPITSMPEMFGVGPLGVMGIPMMIVRRDRTEARFLQELVDPPELNAYGFAVAGSVKVRDAKVSHVNSEGLPQEGAQEKPINDGDKWRQHAVDLVEAFRSVNWKQHLPHELELETVMRGTLGRLEKESRLSVTTIRFARTAGEEMLVERKAMFSEGGQYIFGVDTKSDSPPPVSGSRSMVDDGIYHHLFWLMSDDGRKAYATEIPFYNQVNWAVVKWIIGKITL